MLLRSSPLEVAILSNCTNKDLSLSAIAWTSCLAKGIPQDISPFRFPQRFWSLVLRGVVLENYPVLPFNNYDTANF